MKKAKIEWSAILMLEIIFGVIGIIFTVLGVVFGINIDEIAASPNSHGNVYIMPGVFCGIGIVFLLVFAILLVVSLKQRKNRKQLMENGSYIHACVSEIKQDMFVTINNRHPYYVVCEGVNPYTGEKLAFRSSDIMENPSHLFGQYVRVFVDFKNPKKYYVEINRNHDE